MLFSWIAVTKDPFPPESVKKILSFVHVLIFPAATCLANAGGGILHTSASAQLPTLRHQKGELHKAWVVQIYTKVCKETWNIMKSCIIYIHIQPIRFLYSSKVIKSIVFESEFKDRFQKLLFLKYSIEHFYIPGEIWCHICMHSLVSYFTPA